MDASKEQTLREELHDTNEALNTLMKRMGKSKAYLVAMAIAVGLSLVASVFSFGTVLYVRGEARETDQELREFGNRLFLSSCEISNEGRARDRQNNTSAAEALILVTNSDEHQPEIADAYRQQIQELNRANPNRDCQAELVEATKEVK